MRTLHLLSLLTTLAAGAAQAAGGGAHWTYHGERGPSQWAALDTAYAACAAGRRQSPIDVRGFTGAIKAPLEFSYFAGAIGIQHTGHAVQLAYAPGNGVRVQDTHYELAQMHFHTPAEHQVEGRRYPLEAHFVHRSAAGALAVVAVLYTEGAADPFLADLLTRLPGHAGEHLYLPGRPRAHLLLPASHEYYRYDGSLTTPPCSEPVLWLVLRATRTASAAQIAALHAAVGGDNNRPLQPRHARDVLR